MTQDSTMVSRDVDCMVLARDKVIREMLSTCARSMGLSVHSSGAARLAVQALGEQKFRYQVVLVAPELEDADATRVASALARNPACGRVMGFGLSASGGENPGFEPRSFPIDFVELFVDLRTSCLGEGPLARSLEDPLLDGEPGEEGEWDDLVFDEQELEGIDQAA